MKDRENRRRSKNRFTLLSLPLAHVYMCSMFPQWDAAFCCLRRRRIYFIESGHQACMHVYFIIIIFSFFMPFSSRFPRHIHPDSLVHSPSLSLSLRVPVVILFIFRLRLLARSFFRFIFYSILFYGSLANISARLLLPQSDVSCPSTFIVCRRLRVYFHQLLLFSLNLPIPLYCGIPSVGVQRLHNSVVIVTGIASAAACPRSYINNVEHKNMTRVCVCVFFYFNFSC